MLSKFSQTLYVKNIGVQKNKKGDLEMEKNLEAYKNRLLNEGKSKNTIRSYLRVYKLFLEWFLGTEGYLPPTNVDKELIKEYQQYLSRTGMEGSSISTHLRILKKEFSVTLNEKSKPTYIEILPEILQEFNDWLFKKGYADNTIKGYVYKVADFIKWFENHNGKSFSPSALTDYDILYYRRWLQNQKNARGQINRPAGINNRMFAISKFCSFCVENAKIKSDPTDGIIDLSLPLDRQPTPKWLEKNIQYRFIREVREHNNKRDLAIVLTFIDCGLRLSELLNCTSEDIILYPENEARIVINYSKQLKSRYVPIESKRLRQALLDYIKEEKPEPGQYFFNNKGKRLSDSTIQKMIKKYADRLNIAVTPHSLRHCFAKNLIDSTPEITLQEVAMLMGHFKKNGQPNIETVLIYVTPSMTDIRLKMRSAGK